MPQPQVDLLDPGKGVEDGVVVGHHQQPVPPAVVARVDDDGQPVSEVRGEALGQLRAADAARQHDDPAGRAAHRLTR